ncbi:MAG: radical SAM family heme chaperone HemW [Megasphaera sp.]|jgi:oxygen-independent coproporphyrinogen-3 oxidase|uniref:radical SAM family heme chaperone HemW n=1 Tax=Megasphaera sueciensis TaxID=349094 RepID=UPI003CFCAC90|nr:radical SAM family heme chaperone HemW [Megasphaera sp.]MCI1823127.1 radical SAM family heme chaperone HemW [Megasphaera sp.]
MLGIYIHIPFCQKKCRYCDFPSYGGVSYFLSHYVKALCREIMYAAGAGETADTIYLGGGTPSLLTAQQVESILGAVRNHFSVNSSAEITIEANPNNITETYVQDLCSIGVNRFSLGVQSFSDEQLQRLGRIHTAEEGKHAVMTIREGGISNISADLMFGLPGQSAADVYTDLRILTQLPITHASIYSLIVEEHTLLWDDIRHQRVFLPDEREKEAMVELVHENMAAEGFEHYEISSYCLPGFRSRHNSKYWQYSPYLGFGVSAHSFYQNKRFANIANIPEYIHNAGVSSVVETSVSITSKRAAEDYCILALRMCDGIDYEKFHTLFSTTVETEFGDIIERLFAQQLLVPISSGCRLSKLGFSYGNYVFEQFIRD